MGAIDYKAIREAIRDAILADDVLGQPGKNVVVEIEPGMIDSIERTPWIGIYLDRSDAPSGKQVLRAGTSIDFDLHFILAVAEHSIEGTAQACLLRDEIVRALELVILRNHTLGGTVRMCWQNGTTFENGRTESICIATAFIDLICEVQATI